MSLLLMASPPAKKPRIGEKGDEDIEVTDAAEEEKEKDAPSDGRPKLKAPVRFLTADTTVNVAQSTVGNMLLTIKDGSMHYLCAGARCNVGIKTGRYAFEVKLVETLSPAESSNAKPAAGGPKTIFRLGVSTQAGSLLLGDGDDNCCFDEAGEFMFNKGRLPRTVKTPAVVKADASIVVVLNLDEDTPNFNTISLFVDGARIGGPQALPQSLIGKVLYPTVSFKNLTVHVNFADEPMCPLPFKCRMLEDAAIKDVEVTEDKSGDLEALFPIFLPDKGTYDWCDWFLTQHPSRYVELSDRMLHDWSVNSGLKNQFAVSKQNCNDKPQMGFKIPALDDGTIKETIFAVNAMNQRSFLVMDVKGNLLKEEREAALKKWDGYKKVAQVMMGIPEDAFRQYVHELLIAEKQKKMDAEWEQTKKARELAKQSDLKKKSILRAMANAQKLKTQEEAGEEEAEKTEAKAEEGEVKEEVKDVKMEEEDEKEEAPPVATLSLAEKQVNFRTVGQGDLSQMVMSSCFNKFSLPDESEGFDEIRYSWAGVQECGEMLRRWISDRKVSTRIEDIQPSDWFKEKWADWQKDLQQWHVKHMQYKDPATPKPESSTPVPKAFSKAAPAKPAEESKAAEEKKDGEEEKKPDEEAKTTDEAEKKDEADDEEKKDPLQSLEEELDNEEIDIFAVEDVCNYNGEGAPLFAHFTFEDWAMLSLRFELHLLSHAFRHDADDPERTGIHPDHLGFYYNRYYKKGLNPKNYGVDSVEDLIELVKDTAMADARTKVIESMVTDDLESNDIFVKLTEEARRDRQRRIDVGDASAELKFARPTGGLTPTLGAPTGIATLGGSVKAASMLRPALRPQAAGLGIKPKGGMEIDKASGLKGSWPTGGAFPTKGWGKGSMGMNMGINPIRAKALASQWNANFGSMWGSNWRG